MGEIRTEAGKRLEAIIVPAIPTVSEHLLRIGVLAVEVEAGAAGRAEAVADFAARVRKASDSRAIHARMDQDPLMPPCSGTHAMGYATCQCIAALIDAILDAEAAGTDSGGTGG